MEALVYTFLLVGTLGIIFFAIFYLYISIFKTYIFRNLEVKFAIFNKCHFSSKYKFYLKDTSIFPFFYKYKYKFFHIFF